MICYQNYYIDLAAAAMRGNLLKGPADPGNRLIHAPLEELTEDELASLLDCAQEQGIKLYPFKRGHETLPRVKFILNFLRGVMPESLLDVGSGRGVFLFPFLEWFPHVPVTSLDILPHRVELLEEIRRGGVTRLTPLLADVCAQPLPDASVDVVTLLEVLEHIPDVQAAVTAAVRMARRYVAVTVPSKSDENPEHIHLLTRQRLTELFQNAGCEKLRFDGVNGHLTLIAQVAKENQR